MNTHTHKRNERANLRNASIKSDSLEKLKQELKDFKTTAAWNLLLNIETTQSALVADQLFLLSAYLHELQLLSSEERDKQWIPDEEYTKYLCQFISSEEENKKIDMLIYEILESAALLNEKNIDLVLKTYASDLQKMLTHIINPTIASSSLTHVLILMQKHPEKIQSEIIILLWCMRKDPLKKVFLKNMNAPETTPITANNMAEWITKTCRTTLERNTPLRQELFATCYDLFLRDENPKKRIKILSLLLSYWHDHPDMADPYAVSFLLTLRSTQFKDLVSKTSTILQKEQTGENFSYAEIIDQILEKILQVNPDIRKGLRDQTKQYLETGKLPANIEPDLEETRKHAKLDTASISALINMSITQEAESNIIAKSGKSDRER